MEGMIVDEGVIVEIVTPGTGNPVPEGEVGEVVVTTLNPDYPLVRFATGDMSAVLPGTSPCGRTNMRIKGWMGRADQTTKIKGMFVRPEQVAELVARHPEIARARVIADREGEADVMLVRVEADGGDAARYEASVAEILKLRGRVEVVAPGHAAARRHRHRGPPQVRLNRVSRPQILSIWLTETAISSKYNDLMDLLQLEQQQTKRPPKGGLTSR